MEGGKVARMAQVRRDLLRYREDEKECYQEYGQKKNLIIYKKKKKLGTHLLC